jgi:hypothetical protein
MGSPLHLLYLDDSGDDGRSPASSSHFVLGGLSIRDDEWRPLAKQVDALVEKHLGKEAARTELHGSDMLSGRGFYRGVPAATREALFTEVLTEIGRIASRLTLFFVVIHKQSLPVTRGVRVVATLQLCQRFNSHLTRSGGHAGRGILICDEHASKGQIKSLVAVIHSAGMPKQLRDNLVETAFFVESHESRVLQVADLLCHSVFRFVALADDRFFHLFERKINRGKKPGTEKVIHYGFRYVATTPEAGLGRKLPFKHLTVAPKTGLPVGSFLKVEDLEKELTQHGM